MDAGGTGSGHTAGGMSHGELGIRTVSSKIERTSTAWPSSSTPRYSRKTAMFTKTSAGMLIAASVLTVKRKWPTRTGR